MAKIKGKHIKWKVRAHPASVDCKKKKIKPGLKIEQLLTENQTELKLMQSEFYQKQGRLAQLRTAEEIKRKVNGRYGDNTELSFVENESDRMCCISNHAMVRLAITVGPYDLERLLLLVPFLHVANGVVVNKKRKFLQLVDLENLWKCSTEQVKKVLLRLQKEKIIYKETIKNEDFYVSDSYVTKLALKLKNFGDIESLCGHNRIIIYLNPFIFWKEQYLDREILPYFINSEWYVLNPYSENIKCWIEDFSR